MRKLLTLSLLLAITLTAPLKAGADPDEISLANGDTVRGRIVAVTAESITLESGVLGRLEIPVAEVIAVISEAPVRVTTASGRTFDGRLMRDANGVLRITEIDGTGASIDELVPPSAILQDAVDEEDKSDWTGSLSGGFALLTGNTDRRTANVDANAVKDTEADRITLQFTWNYDEDKDDVTREWDIDQRRTFGKGQYDYKLDECQYVYGLATGEHDLDAGIDTRWTIGSGIGRTMFDAEEFDWRLELGISWVDENRDDGEDTDFWSGRAASNATWQVSADLKAQNELQALQSLEESHDFLFRSITRLQYSFTKSWFSEFRWEWAFDNTPSAGDERADSRYFLNIGYSF